MHGFDVCGIDHGNGLTGGHGTADRAKSDGKRVFGLKKCTAGARRRGARQNKLMRRIARTFIGLKHTVAESVLFSQREVRLHVGGGNVSELRIRRTPEAIANFRNPIRAIHFSIVVHIFGVGVSVTQVVCSGEWNRSQRNDAAMGVHATAGDVRTPGDEYRILEKIAWSSVLLKNDDDVRNNGVQMSVDRIGTAASAQATKNPQAMAKPIMLRFTCTPPPSEIAFGVLGCANQRERD